MEKSNVKWYTTDEFLHLEPVNVFGKEQEIKADETVIKNYHCLCRCDYLYNSEEKAMLKITADDYYETEKFNNAVTIVSPAKYSAGGFIKSAISESIRLLIIAELLLITLYLSVSIGLCFGSKAKAFKDKHFR